MPKRPGENNQPANNDGGVLNQENQNPEENILPQQDLDGGIIENNDVLPPGAEQPAEDDDIEVLNIEEEQKAQALNQEIANAPEGSYLQLVGVIRQQPCAEGVVANMIAATILMQRGRTAQADLNAMADLSQKMMGQPSFAMLMKDPNTKKFLKAGKGVELIELMAVKESERKRDLEKYRRPQEFVARDGLVLRTAIEKIREKEEKADAAAGAGEAAAERKGRLYQEMMKQLEYAEGLAEQGIQLSGEDSKKLIDAVKKYNDSGSKIPGGPKAAKARTEAMCVLKRFMPEDEFQAYCSGISARRKKPLDPEAFSEKRLTGEEQRVSDLQKKCREDLQRHFTVENCAALVASKITPAKNGILDAAAYEQEKAKLMANGSAFRKALQDEDVKKKVSDLVKNGVTANKIIKAVDQGALDHAGKTAQWQFNRSKAFLLSGRVNTHLAGEHLANLMALNKFINSAGMEDKLTNKGFAERAEAIENDPAFRRMADRYSSDPQYKTYLNNKLREDGTGELLAQEYGRVERSMHRQGRQAGQQPAQDQPERQLVQEAARI